MFNIFNTKTNFENIDGNTFRSMSNDPDTIIIDVRTKEEFNSGKIEGAINYDLLSGEFASVISEFDKDKTYLIYCRSGARSSTACNMLADLGFQKLYNLKGGIISY
ncbi:rhodanese-like domain-containing protein [Marinigracilibium pacificum]|uniref:Rhodanese-like domain-containing protein n=1 Tax=Marinigracilibium pacificum TaxID=2729599 RepID=A0A848J9Y2_9BACT|nr:rhodanese-like domain-containing protein [Marinigracilibium pacificum]NMM49852.1 rhodanese-like domain-containing protein [Marinigracilibium pacificum]